LSATVGETRDRRYKRSIGQTGTGYDNNSFILPLS